MMMTPQHNRIFSLLSALCIVAACPVLDAAEACFSKDGTRVYLMMAEATDARVEEIHLEDGTHRVHAFPKQADMGVIQQLECLDDGALLLMSSNAIWKWTAGQPTAAKVQTAPKGTMFDEMAVNHANKGLAVWCWVQAEGGGEGARDGTLMFAKTPKAKLERVRMRRVGDVNALCFHGEGELYFGTEGDLWKGTIEEEEGLLNLTAERFAPLSDRETYNGTPSQMGVERVAVSAGKVYSHVGRMGGSGWGNVVRLFLPADCEPAPEIKDMRRQLMIYSKALSSVEVLEENGSLSFLCASLDGKRVFFTNRYSDDRTCFLVENDGAPEPVKVLPVTKP